MFRGCSRTLKTPNSPPLHMSLIPDLHTICIKSRAGEISIEQVEFIIPTGWSIYNRTILFVNCSGCRRHTDSPHTSFETSFNGKTPHKLKKHVSFGILLQNVLKVTAPVRHHLGQPNLLQVHDGPVDHVLFTCPHSQK